MQIIDSQLIDISFEIEQKHLQNRFVQLTRRHRVCGYPAQTIDNCKLAAYSTQYLAKVFLCPTLHLPPRSPHSFYFYSSLNALILQSITLSPSAPALAIVFIAHSAGVTCCV